ncbi:hypothetical protein [Pseudonocardia sp. TRM90224]|uniref:hypothetical protein n=1 Tax=Pseudonocardia sp. TRM90224 TaxID=2812678 RepID=UPI001E5E8932|nr:hypothetical protein [Pseudonocardia sp. TRM90224]
MAMDEYAVHLLTGLTGVDDDQLDAIAAELVDECAVPSTRNGGRLSVHLTVWSTSASSAVGTAAGRLYECLAGAGRPYQLVACGAVTAGRLVHPRQHPDRHQRQREAFPSAQRGRLTAPR